MLTQIAFLLVLPALSHLRRWVHVLKMFPPSTGVSTYHRFVHVPVGVFTSWEYVHGSQAHLHPEDVTMCLQVCLRACRCVHISLSFRMRPGSHDFLLKSDGHCPVMQLCKKPQPATRLSVVVDWFSSFWWSTSNGHDKHEKNHRSSVFDEVLPKDIDDILEVWMEMS